MDNFLYNEEAYKKFAHQIREALTSPTIEHTTLKRIKNRALKSGLRTRYGSYVWRSFISSRIGPKTVYLGSDHIRLPKLTPVMRTIVENAPAELEKVVHILRTLPFIHIRRQMGRNDRYNPVCNLFVCAADQKNLRLAYMWGHTLRDVSHDPGPEFVMIHIPEEHQLRQQVLVLPEHNINIALGTDYMGEDKKGFLRQAMWYADEHGMLGLHAGTKIVTAINSKTGKLEKTGVFLFGLSATGKSTWSCHQLGLDFSKKERTEVIQDDIVFLCDSGEAFGTEVGYFVKTDVDKKLQEAMYHALTHKSAFLENVMLDADGKPDFLDESLCANGRSVIRMNELKVKRGRRLKGIYYKSINMPPLEELDAMIFAFITRRNTIMPFAQELTASQAVLAYLWGESSHSAASEPDKAGKSVRTVGTDPFIIGSRAKKVNRFHDIIMKLMAQYPGKIRFFQYNTGGMGERMEAYEEGGVRKTKILRKAERVPIEVMAAIQRGDLRGTNQYEKGRFGTREIVRCEGHSLEKYRPENYYSKEQIDGYLREIVEGRRVFTEEIAAEGLKPEILREAEKSFSIAPAKSTSVFVREPAKQGEDAEDDWSSLLEKRTKTGDDYYSEKPQGWRYG